MRKLLFGLITLFASFTATASVDHWTCSNDATVLYLVLDTNGGSFMLWDDKGQYLAGAKLSVVNKTPDGIPFAAAQLENGVAIGIAKGRDKTLILAIAKNTESEAARFICN